MAQNFTWLSYSYIFANVQGHMDLLIVNDVDSFPRYAGKEDLLLYSIIPQTKIYF